MSIQIAIASTDGKVVNTHFGKAERFFVVRYQEGRFEPVGFRETERACHMGDHEISSFERTAEVLSDCAIILVSRIGPGAAAFLEGRGFAVYEAPFAIPDVLKRLAEELEGSSWQSTMRN